MILLYSISRMFLDRQVSLYVLTFVLIVSFFNFKVFNFNTPYSSAIIYGLSTFYAALLALLKFIENNNIKLFWVFTVFSAFSIAFKYEFLLFPFFALGFLLFSKKINLKQTFLSAILIPIPTVLSFLVVLLQGVCAKDIIYAFELMKKMTNTKSLKFFYTLIGFYPSSFILYKELILFLKSTLMAIFVYFSIFFSEKIKEKQKFVSNVILFVIFCLTFVFARKMGELFFVYFPILLLFITLINIKKLLKNQLLLILIFVSLISGMKIFFLLNFGLYGTIYLPLILISLVATILFLLENQNKCKINFAAAKKTIIFFILAFSFIFLVQELKISSFKNTLIQSGNHFNRLYTFKDTAALFNKEIDYIKKTTKQTDTVLVMPEGHLLNYLSGRPSDNFYHSIMPVYVEMFGEEDIINRLKKTKPKLIVIHNKNLEEYGTPYICKDFAQNVCLWIYDNYKLTETFDENGQILLNYERIDN